MSLFTNPSAGVYVQEIDNSQRVQAVSTSIGAVVGLSRKGPVGAPKLITSNQNFLQTFGDPDVTQGYFHYSALAFLLESQRLWCVRVPDNSTYGGVSIKMKGSVNEMVPWSIEGIPYNYTDESFGGIKIDEERKYLPNYNFDPDDVFVIFGKDPGAWNNKISVKVVPNPNGEFVPTELDTFFVYVFYGDSFFVIEKFLVALDYRLDGYGRQLQLENAINDKSEYIRVQINPNFVLGPLTTVNTVLDKMLLAGGNDGNLLDSANAGQRDGVILQGWQMFADPEEIDVNILIQAGYTDNSQIAITMDQICRDRMDCVAILDVPIDYQDTIQEVVGYRRGTGTGTNDLASINSSYSALYAPHLYISDQYNGKKLFVPPSGYVAGVYARTDRLAETWFAPAGMNRGDLDVLGVYKVYNQGDRDYLVESQVNPIRLFYGQGIKVWGQDTMQAKASSLSNMSVRRLMNFLEKSISIAALYSVFDPNDSILRRQLETICTQFLRPIKSKRGIYDFGVTCDDSNNPPEVVGNGDLILDIFIDPVLPVKRILLNAIIPRTGGIQFAVSQINS